MPETSSPPPAGANAASPLQLVFSWLFVGIPLAWGVWEVAAKSLDLFTK
jgi:hypothetical protein